MVDPRNPVDSEENVDTPDAAAGAPTVTVGGATLGPATQPADSGRRADSLFTPDVTGGSEGFANTAGGTLLAPDVAPEDADPNAGN